MFFSRQAFLHERRFFLSVFAVSVSAKLKSASLWSSSVVGRCMCTIPCAEEATWAVAEIGCERFSGCPLILKVSWVLPFATLPPPTPTTSGMWLDGPLPQIV